MATKVTQKVRPKLRKNGPHVFYGDFIWNFTCLSATIFHGRHGGFFCFLSTRSPPHSGVGSLGAPCVLPLGPFGSVGLGFPWPLWLALAASLGGVFWALVGLGLLVPGALVLCSSRLPWASVGLLWFACSGFLGLLFCVLCPSWLHAGVPPDGVLGCFNSRRY